MKGLLPHHREMLESDSSITAGVVKDRGYFTATTVDELKAIGFHSADSAQVPSLVIPIHGVDGDIVYYQHRPDTPRARDGKPVKYESLPGQPPRIDIPPSIKFMLDDPNIPLWITEGSKKADSAAVRGLCCVALIGVWNWRGTNTKGGSLELADWDRIAIKGRIIYIAFDSDVMVKPEVKKALQRLARFLKRRGAKEIRPVVIPKLGAGKTGLDDWFAAGNGYTELMQSVDKDLLRHDGIVVNNRGLADITADALAAVIESNFPPSIFVRSGELVRIKVDERSIAKIEGLGASAMRSILARCSSWVVAKKDGPIEVSPPKDVVEDLLALPEWYGIPPVIAITMAPIMGPNGCLSMAPGYDPESHFFVATQEVWPEWDGTVEEAVDFILNDLLYDFPFAKDADRAHALALMLLPIVRPSISGPTPLHLVDAPVQATGKSRLVRICLTPTMGDKISATTATRDEEEWRKKIASSLLEGKPYIFFDNLSRKVDSEALAGALTATEWNDRALSTMRNINVPVRCLWVATSNNAELSKDIVQRTIWIRLDSKLERPEDRRDFKHPDIDEWVKVNSNRIVSALCKLITSWIENGKPRWEGRLVRSYEEWSKVIGGIITNAGVEGFLGNVEELRSAANPEEEAWKGFYFRWINHSGSAAVTAGSLLEEFRSDDMLAGMLGDKGDASQRTRLGFLVKKRVGIVCGGYCIQRDPAEFRGSVLYRLVAVEGVGNETANPLTTPSNISSNDLGSNGTLFEGVEGVEGVINNPTHMRMSAHAPTHTREEATFQPPQPPHLNLNGFSTPSQTPSNFDDDTEVII